MTFDSSLLEILACPKCKAPVELEQDRLVCVQCGRRYRIEDGIPIMLIDEAEPPLDSARGGPPGPAKGDPEPEGQDGGPQGLATGNAKGG